jgi:hypothetical protein
MSDKNLFPRLRVGSVIIVAVTGLATMLPTSGPGVAHAAPAESIALPPMPEVSGPVHDVPAGGALPSEATCAARVQRVAESRPQNASANQTRGSSPNNENPRVTGNFVGTTDEIIQWAACKWGLDPSWARAQALVESFWIQSTVGDNGESFGILQVRRPYHQSAFEGENAVRSTAYNADYAWSIWRRCFNGEYTWLNTVERGRTYAAGDSLGCIGLWFAGRWYTDAAVGYMNRVAGTSVPSTPSSPSRPSAPRSLVGVPGNGYVRLTWAAPLSNGGAAITDYVIQRSWDGGRTWWSLSDGVSTSRLYWATGLANGSTYRFRVAARNAAGYSPVSNVVTATPHATVSSPPRFLAAAVAPAAGVGSGQVRLSWAAPANTGGYPITDYVIQRSWDGGRTWWSLSDGVSTSRTALISGHSNGATYRFRVAARNRIGYSAVSNVVVATPRAPTTFAATVTASALPEPTTATASPPTTAAPSTTSSTSTSTSTTTTTPVASTTTTGAIGDLVWLDANGDGRQAASEAGVAGVTVRLLDSNGVSVATTRTDEHGGYEFTASADGVYRVEIDLQNGFTVTSADVGPDDEADSDAVQVDELARTARTAPFELAVGNAATGLDIGLVPTPPAEPTTTTVTVPATTAPTTTAPSTTVASTTAPPPPTSTGPTTTTAVASTTTVAPTTTTTLAPS